MLCTTCGSPNTAVQAVAETQGRGCLTILWYMLLAISVCGWVILLPALMSGRGSKTTSYRICNDCGARNKLRG